MTSYEQQVRINTNSRLDRLEDKVDAILGRLEYLCATDNEKKFMFTDGSTNYDAICESCDDIAKEMIEMRD